MGLGDRRTDTHLRRSDIHQNPSLHQGHEQVSAEPTRVEGFSHTPRFLGCFQYPGYTQEAPYPLTPQFSSPEKSDKPQTTSWSAVFPHLWDAKTQPGISCEGPKCRTSKTRGTFCRLHQTHVRMTRQPGGGRNTGLVCVFTYLFSWTRFKARL